MTTDRLTEQPREYLGYDLVGDVHGCGDRLVELLDKLGYRKVRGVYEHAQRQAVFIGDIVDRGPRIREALQLVYAMVERGSAQMVVGNHEYNCVTYCTHDPSAQGVRWLRDHSKRHSRMLEETLEQFANYPLEWQEYLAWFRRLPLFLEFEDFRVVHACWDNEMVSTLRQRGIFNLEDDNFLKHSVRVGTPEWKIVDRLLRGTYLRLPNDEVLISEDGYARHFYRTKFWESRPQRHQDVVFQPDPLPHHVAGLALNTKEKKRLHNYDLYQPLLFVGHYWLKGKPEPITPNIVCLDYSAVKGGRLVAYRKDFERRADANKFVWVDSPD